jgi:hypothetical protein
MPDLSKPPRPEDIKRSLAAAIRERRYESILPLLSVLARNAPADAEAVYGAMLAVLPGDAVDSRVPARTPVLVQGGGEGTDRLF